MPYDTSTESAAETTHPVVLRFAEMLPSGLAGYEMHRSRRGGDLGHVDAARSGANRVLIGEPGWIRETLAEIDEMRRANLAEEVGALRDRKRHREVEARLEQGLTDPWRASRGGPLREVILTANAEWFEGIDMGHPELNACEKRSREEGFVLTALTWLGTRFGTDVIHARVDYDEAACHVHAIIMPRTEKVSARRGRQRLIQPSAHPLLKDYEKAQDDAGGYFAQIGLRRGDPEAEARREALAADEEVAAKRRHTRPAKWRADEERRLREEAEAQAREAERIAARNAEIAARTADQAERDALQAARDAEIAERERQAARRAADAEAGVAMVEAMAAGYIEIAETAEGPRLRGRSGQETDPARRVLFDRIRPGMAFATEIGLRIGRGLTAVRDRAKADGLAQARQEAREEVRTLRERMDSAVAAAGRVMSVARRFARLLPGGAGEQMHREIESAALDMARETVLARREERAAGQGRGAARQVGEHDQGER